MKERKHISSFHFGFSHFGRTGIMPTHSPSKEVWEHAVLDFAWRCGQKAKYWSKAHGLIPWVRLEKLLSAFTQGWRGESFDVPDFLLQKTDLLDIAESGYLEAANARGSSRR